RDWKYDAHVNLGAGQLRTEALCEADLSELRGRIGAHVGNAPLSDDRRDHNDMPSALLPEDRQRSPRGVIRTEVVDFEKALHLDRGDRVDRPIHAKACIAYHHIEPAEALDGGSDECRH